MEQIKAFFNWSGGKDSALALYRALQDPQLNISALLTTVNAQTRRISMHGVRDELLKTQAQAIGLPLRMVELSAQATMHEYDSLMQQQLKAFKAEGISTSVFGDIFLEDLKTYRENKLQEEGMKAHFPLWQHHSPTLVREFLSLGFRTIVVAVDGRKLDASFVGRELNESFLNDLPANVDPCGENGEFHTFVFEGPLFKEPIAFEKKEVVAKTYDINRQTGEKATYYFQELVPVL